MTDNRPWSEQIYEAHTEWVDLDSAARMYEETKTIVFAQKCQSLGDIPVNRAEQTIKATREWYDWVANMVTARTQANKARAKLEFLRTKKDEYMNEEANHRAEARL